MGDEDPGPTVYGRWGPIVSVPEHTTGYLAERGRVGRMEVRPAQVVLFLFLFLFCSFFLFILKIQILIQILWGILYSDWMYNLNIRTWNEFICLYIYFVLCRSFLFPYLGHSNS